MWSLIQAAGWPIWLLIFSSVVALALIIERLWMLRQATVAPKGLVDRVRSETDRRVVHLRLTPLGEVAVAQVPHVLAAVNNDFLRGVSESEWKQLCKTLDRMAENGVALQGEGVAA